ncbi:autophagy-related protein 2 homolog B-like [Pollicipes pollicipes]|uniref:autophagy-related protein 2 homolog B-like n=1 Tax=Pollicipes pollicipes TaxID=41117 RepID=UPI001884A19E|nr:autophagy-related protein 2 homolog B-like [Pollicipes pollicipes]
MPWKFPWSDSIKKRACRYLLQRYLGQFLKEKLTLEQLSVDIYEGTGEIKDILLDFDALNDVGAANNLPVEFVDGYIRRVRVTIPWSSLLTASSYVEISGLMLTVQAKQMLDDAAMFDSMLDSMSTSTMDMAKECLGQVADQRVEADTQTLEGIEALAGAIDSVLMRIKVRFLDTVVRLEHVGQEMGRGVGVEIKIARMDYMDEAGRELDGGGGGGGPLQPAALSVKRLSLDRVTLHCAEFPAACRAAPGCMAASFSEDREDEEETQPGLPPPGGEPVLLGQFNGRTELRCEVKVHDTAPGPKLNVQITSGSFCTLLGPRQLHDLMELMSGIIDPKRVEKSAPRPCGAGRHAEKPMTPSDYQVIEEQLVRRNLAARDLLTTQALRAQGWSSHAHDEDEEEFLPLLRPDAALTSSAVSLATSADMDGSMTSSVTGSVYSEATSTHRSEMSYTRPRPRRRRDRGKDEEQSEDSIRLSLQLSTVCVVLMHEDVLTTAPDTQLLTPASIKQMQRLAEAGLARLSSVCVGGGGVRGTRPDLLEACPCSHLSLVAAPLKFECSERPSGGSKSVFSMTLTSGMAELLECLVERDSASAPAATYTEVITGCQALVNRHTASPAVSVRLRLAACASEVDVSLADRLSALLSPAAGPVRRGTSPTGGEHAHVTKQQCFNDAMDDTAGSAEAKVDVQVTAPAIAVKLRFPIPDLRPLSDMKRPPWWCRHRRHATGAAGAHRQRGLRRDGRRATGRVPRQGEELVIPAGREEVERFIDSTVANCQMLLELSLPLLEAILPSKRFYELIYNRLATDLALWEPAAPGSCASPEAAHPPDPLALLADPFQMCKSGTQYDSDSDSDASDTLYQSVYEQRQRQRRRQRNEDELARSRQSRCCVRLQLGQGVVALQTPCVAEEGAPVPDHHGEVQLAVDSGSLFVVSGYGGMYGHGFVCLSAHRASLYHKGQMPTRFTPLLPSLDAIPPCLDRLVGPYEAEPAGQPNADDMLSVAVKYQLDELNNIKTFTVAVGVDGCALRPRMLPSLERFVTQLLDMFDVVDFPVAGYDMPATVTQLHLLVTRSALDYRPLNLPYQYLVTVDSFILSSHLAAATSTSVLRFILEEAALHVADRSGAPLVGARDYVCVLEAGLLELSIRTSVAPAAGQPHLDWRVSNNTIHVRTCADSLRALVELVTYLAGDGDRGEPAPAPTTPPPPARAGVRQAGADQAGLVDLMEDAMQEASPPRPAPAQVNQGPVEVFFFPNEPHVAAPPPPPQLATEAVPSNTVMATMAEALADIDDEFDDADEGFFVLDDDPGSGIRSRSGEPQVRVLTSEPIRVIDDFLPAPVSRADVLRPPTHFPVPRRRYTLQQMSVFWSLYGGHDLASSGAPPPTRKVRIESPAATPPGSPRARLGQAAPGSPLQAAFSKHGAQQVRFGTLASPEDEAPALTAAAAARRRGGPGRHADTMMQLRLSKARCQLEEYPEDTEEARRLVLVANDVEVLDRITSSDMNKFLYQYSSESCPRQAHSNMVLLKALCRRPDPAVATEECDVRLSLCPIRLNVDQDALFFLRDFFRAVAGEPGGSGRAASPDSDAPVLSITQQDAPLGPGEDEPDEDEDEEAEPAAGAVRPAEQHPIFFRTFTFSPEVLIRIDYQGKRVDIGQFGPLIGLLIGLGQLNCSEIRLKRISHKSGLLGLDRLVHFALNEWLTDIRSNQLPSLLGGIGPLHSFVQLFQGIRDLLWLPIEQYQKDGRIVKGLQRGANSFSTSTAMAFLELTNRLVGYIQGASEFAYDMMSPGPSVRQKRKQKRSRRRTSNLPQDLREGVTNAYELVKEGLGETAQTLARVAAEEHDQRALSGAVGGVLRQIPPTVVKPILLVSEATSNVLGGMRNQLAPDARREAIDKWKAAE